MSDEDALRSLREAVELSPDNLPLRRHLAESLLQMGRLDEAGEAFRAALQLAPQDPSCRFGLGRIFYRAGQFSEALVLIEALCEDAAAPAAAHILHARILRREGNVAEAVVAYKKGVKQDREVADESLAAELGIDALPKEDIQDGRVAAIADEAGETIADVERPDINFKDVGGMESLKEDIRLKIIYPLEKPELYEAYGKKVGGGILLYGPPGCGKTHLARAVAGEIKANFINVGINDVLDMWLGNSERNLASIFDNAREHKPCVLFFDEVDALAAKRSDMRNSAGRMVINQFLSELDGIDKNNDGLLILAATNAPWHMDSAFRRPGRFDRIIFVPPPDQDARAEIIRLLLKDKPCDDIDVDALAKKANEFSGADLKAVVDLAIESKLQDALKAGKPVPLTQKDLLKGIKQQRPTAKEWFGSARNHALYANQGGLYDDVLDYLKIKR